jgi:hypothetical protein
MHTHAHRPAADPPLVAVSSPGDIEFLVKESEVLTGLPGRTFVIAGADRLIYRVQWHSMGFRVERLDAQGRVLCSQHLLRWEFIDHSLVDALHAGQLFTPSVRHQG